LIEVSVLQAPSAGLLFALASVFTFSNNSWSKLYGFKHNILQGALN